MGVEQKDISRAIWDGDLSPAIPELEAVYGEFALQVLRQLGATVKPGVEWFNQGNIIDLAEIFDIPHYNYLKVKKLKEEAYEHAWIDSFGPMPDSFFEFLSGTEHEIVDPEYVKTNVSVVRILTSWGKKSEFAKKEYRKKRNNIFKTKVENKLR